MLWRAFSGQILACGGVNPWPNRNRRYKFDQSAWSNNQAYHNQPSGGLLGAKSAVGRKGSSACGNKK